MKKSKNKNGAILIDIILLPLVFGPLIIFLTVRYLYRWLGMKKWILPFLFILTLLGFWLTSGLAYFDYLSQYPLFSSITNEYMWNWPLSLLGIKLVEDIPTYKDFFGFWNILAIVIFVVVYPLLLYIGIQIGFLSYGRSHRQKGTVVAFFKRSAHAEIK
jgi:hypothetical protein